MSMTFAHLRSVAETLGRFASIRDKAPEPTDRIIVQSTKGNLRLVAGDEAKVVVAECGPAKGDDAMALVSSRLLLSAAKSLKGKGEVWFEGDSKGCTLKTEQGGEVRMPNVANDLPAFLRPVPSVVESRTEPGLWPAVAKAVTALSGPLVGLDMAPDGSVWLSSLTSYFGLRVRIAGEGEYQPPSDWWLIDSGFVESLRGLDGAGAISHGSSQTQVTCWPFRAATVERTGRMSLHHTDEWNVNRRAVLFAETKELIDLIQPLAHDQFKRVMFDVEPGQWKVRSYDGKGEVTWPSSLSRGHGDMTFSTCVDADLLTKALRVWPDRRVTLGFAPGRPVELVGREDDDWVIYVAPVALA